MSLTNTKPSWLSWKIALSRMLVGSSSYPFVKNIMAFAKRSEVLVKPSLDLSSPIVSMMSSTALDTLDSFRE